MTLIAFATNGKRADIITDTFSYTGNGREFSRSYKPMHLPHLDNLVVLTQGSTIFGRLADVQAAELANHLPSFDQFLDEAPQAWQEVHERADLLLSRDGYTDALKGCGEPAVFAVGYSATEGRFRAYGFDAGTNYQPWPVDGLFVHPSPLSMRPSDLELRRMVDVADPADLEHFKGLPAPKVPTTPDGWLALAKATRERALLDVRTGVKVFVGGQVWHTRVTPGSHSTRVAYTFNDSGAEFQRMVAGTLHPQGQLGPCLCGSDRAYVDCCLAGLEDEPCDCGSGTRFADCCRVDLSELAATAPVPLG